MGMFDAFGEQARLGQESPLQTIPVPPTLPEYMTPQNPTTTTTAVPAKPIVRQGGNKQGGGFDSDVLKAFTSQLATQAKGAGAGSGISAPGLVKIQGDGNGLSQALIDRKSGSGGGEGGLSSIYNPTRDEFKTRGNPSIADRILGLGKEGRKKEDMGDLRLDDEGVKNYLNAKIERLQKVAELAGDDPDVMKQRALYALGQIKKTGVMDTDLASAEGVLAELEAPLAETVIVAESGEPIAAAAEEIPGSYTPDEQAAIQVAIGQFMKPYADQAVLTGQNAANILNSTASSIQDPAYRAVVQQQAALAQQSGANTGLSIMKQAGVLPAIQALENQRQQAAQIQSLQNQLLQQQSQQVGTQDFGALLAQAGLGQ